MLYYFPHRKNSQLASCYKRIFGLQAVKEFFVPDGTVTGILMCKEESVLEVFNRNDALERDDYAPAALSGQWAGSAKSDGLMIV
ncbi:MAG: hypothetical protein ACI87W_002841 [Halieaceae bacterium]